MEVKKTIYVSHSTKYNFKKELYEPILNSELSEKYNFIFPHQNSNELFNTLGLFKEGCDLILCECSDPSFGVGIELGWATQYKIPIVAILKRDKELSSSIKSISNLIYKYDSSNNIEQLLVEVDKYINNNI